MTHEKEIAELRKWAERYNKTGGLPALDVGLKALALVETQQLEIEALKGGKDLVMKEMKRLGDCYNAELAENAELKEKLEIATNTLNILSTKQIFEPATTNSYAREALEQLKKK